MELQREALRLSIKGTVSSRCEVNLSEGRVIRKGPSETGHHCKGKDGALLLGRVIGRSWDGAGP